MKVQRIMRHGVKTCHPHDSLNDAAQIMWEDACGSVPVVDEEFRPVGFLTDRDICMAAYTQGAPLGAMCVASAMARRVVSCSPEDDVTDAARVMRENGVRRLPVVDAEGRLVGLLSLDDLACEFEHTHNNGLDRELGSLLAHTYGAICHARCRLPDRADPPMAATSWHSWMRCAEIPGVAPLLSSRRP
ncbi:MAG TPA: CBS domain-containing protein [Candidatus Binataceae bacterium]|nr:CBS domain-containing protein [Candidatus Binataceae bacterium]